MMLILILLAFLQASLSLEEPHTTHKCIHNEISKRYAHQHVHHPKITKPTTSFKWQPIRMHLDYSHFESSTAFGKFIQSKIMPNVITKIQSIFSVHRPEGSSSLKLGRSCVKINPNTNKCLRYNTSMCLGSRIPRNMVTGEGIPEKDFILFVDSEPIDGNAIAWAGACQFMSNGRPVAGKINFRPQFFNFESPKMIDDYMRVALHEILHALGFSQQIWNKLYRHPTTGQVYVPTQNFTERGATVTKFVSPNALAKAREYFNCPSLNGVEVESSGGLGTAGSHLEQRVLNDALMTGSLMPAGWQALSTIELAILEDSGWYKVDYSQAGKNYWGKGQGCQFAMDKCITGTPSSPRSNFPKYFCTSDSVGCTQSRRGVGQCYITPNLTPIPSQFQYFGKSTVGGLSSLTDYCPFYQPTWKRNCIYSEDAPVFSFFGETYASNARCLSSTLLDERYADQEFFEMGSGCYSIGCKSSPSYTVTVKGQVQTCTKEGQLLKFKGYEGSVTCASWKEVCG